MPYIGLSIGHVNRLPSKSLAGLLLGTVENGVARNYRDNSLVIRDTVTPANNYNGPLITNNAFNKGTFTRASTATFVGSDGLIQSAAVNVPRIQYDPVTLAIQGLLIEGARTNVVLHNRDMTNAAWTNTNITAAKDQVGADGVANSASSLTATAANGTCLQAITLASSARAQSVYIKRITGTGTINMTMDNGSTWTAVTVTAAWTKVRIPTQTLANPTVGFRIVTDGDAVAVDYCQNENGTYDSSAIPTTTVAVARSADVGPIFASTLFNLTQAAGTLYVRNTWDGGTAINAGNRAPLTVESGAGEFVTIYNTSSVASGDVRDGGVQQAVPLGAAVADGVFTKIALAYAANDVAFVQDNGTPVTDTSATLPVTDKLTSGDINAFGSINLFGTIAEDAFFGERLSNAVMQTLTT